METPSQGGQPARARDRFNRTRAVDTLDSANPVQLDLDEVLERRVGQDPDGEDGHGRLRGLLRAYLAVSNGLDLDQVLRHIVSAARELANARYAALAVIRDGRLVQFLSHEGTDAATAASIGALLHGRGVLGQLVDNAQTLRVADITSQEAFLGFPPHHPTMRSFLGVPIQIGDRVFGNLYLADKRDGAEFGSVDEALAQALALAAGLALDNGFERDRGSRGRQHDLVGMTTALLTDNDPDRALPNLVHDISDAGVAEPFDTADQASIGVIASRAALTIDLAAAHRDAEQLHLVEDRLRIGERLRETVISRLFTAGLSIQAVLPRVTEAEVHDTLTNHIDELDAIITEIRSTTFPRNEGPAITPT